jgi:hypothetical protein
MQEKLTGLSNTEFGYPVIGCLYDLGELLSHSSEPTIIAAAGFYITK